MRNELFKGIPDYVRITIYSQTSYLMSFPFIYQSNDCDDIIQSLLLFYLSTFYRKKIINEAYVVASIRNEARRIIRTKVREHFGPCFSLDDIVDTSDEPIIYNFFDKYDIDFILSSCLKRLTDEENSIIDKIYQGYSLEEIAKEKHISKNTIYKIFEKMRKIIKREKKVRTIF